VNRLKLGLDQRPEDVDFADIVNQSEQSARLHYQASQSVGDREMATSSAKPAAQTQPLEILEKRCNKRPSETKNNKYHACCDKNEGCN